MFLQHQSSVPEAVCCFWATGRGFLLLFVLLKTTFNFLCASTDLEQPQIAKLLWIKVILQKRIQVVSSFWYEATKTSRCEFIEEQGWDVSRSSTSLRNRIIIAGAVRGKFRPQVTKSQLHVVIPGPRKRRWCYVCSWWPMNTPCYFQTPWAASGKWTPAEFHTLSAPLSDITGVEICHLQFISSTFLTFSHN